MATIKNNNRNNMNNGNVTRVICSNCGAEIVIPNEEIKHVVGTVIGQNSGMGTIILPTKNGQCDNHGKHQGANNKISSNSVVSEALKQLKAIAKSNQDIQNLVDTISSEIEDGGYVDVQGIVRRWIPSQFLEMLYSERGFQNALNVKGFNYGWSVLERELKRLVKDKINGDEEDFLDRVRWYNKDLVIVMMMDYINKLCKYANELQRKHCKGKEYIKISCDWLNNGKGVFVRELDKLYTPFKYILEDAGQSSTYEDLYKLVVKFNLYKSGIRWTPEYHSNEFNNAYKAAGAYYTLKDLILFEGCGMIESTLKVNGQTRVRLADQECSLSMLENYVDDLIKNKNILECGYMLLGYAKRFLEVNEFNFKETKEKWAGQSKIRREARRNNRINRRIK